MGQIIDGKARAAELRGDVAKAVDTLKDKYRLTPGLAVVLVGDDPVWESNGMYKKSNDISSFNSFFIFK